MRAAILKSPGSISLRPLEIAQAPQPELRPGHVLIRVRACGACRTDLYIVEGELPPRKQPLIPGHQIVGEITDGHTPALPLGTRVGVSRIGGTDGTCRYCLRGSENLCDTPTFTGYTVNGGDAEFVLGRSDFVIPLPATLDDLGKPRPWRGRSETDEASWGTAVGPPLYTTHWGLLKQPDNQKIACFSVFVPNSGLPQILEAPISRLIVLAAEVLDPRAMA